MSEDGDDRAPANPEWKQLPRDRPWYRKLGAQQLAEAEVHAPDGNTYLVQVARNAPFVGLPGTASGDSPIAVAADLIRANLLAGGATGWTISVLRPATTWTSERALYRQPVGAKAILVDVILAITNALSRGDTLWPDDEHL